MESQRKSMEFHDFPMYLGKSGIDLIHPSKLCAALFRKICTTLVQYVGYGSGVSVLREAPSISSPETFEPCRIEFVVGRKKGAVRLAMPVGRPRICRSFTVAIVVGDAKFPAAYSVELHVSKRPYGPFLLLGPQA